MSVRLLKCKIVKRFFSNMKKLVVSKYDFLRGSREDVFFYNSPSSRLPG